MIWVLSPWWRFKLWAYLRGYRPEKYTLHVIAIALLGSAVLCAKPPRALQIGGAAGITATPAQIAQAAGKLPGIARTLIALRSRISRKDAKAQRKPKP